MVIETAVIYFPVLTTKLDIHNHPPAAHTHPQTCSILFHK